MRVMGGLRKYLPITSVTFIIGWLAIVGVPPFAGFWSQDEILAFAFDESWALWAVGLVTAVLTAFYMSRQVFLVFFGPERWRDLPGPDDAVEGELVGPGPDHEPHESPWTMTVPLIVLAVLAFGGGFVNLAVSEDLLLLEHWLEPVVEEAQVKLTLSTGAKIGLALLATIAGLIGIGLAVRVYLRRKVDPARVERKVLVHGWYIDESMARFVDGPGRTSFDWTAVFDRRVIDGAVMGLGGLVRRTSDRLRSVQTGYVRTYALTVGMGTVLLVAYVLTRVTL